MSPAAIRLRHAEFVALVSAPEAIARLRALLVSSDSDTATAQALAHGGLGDAHFQSQSALSLPAPLRLYAAALQNRLQSSDAPLSIVRVGEASLASRVWRHVVPCGSTLPSGSATRSSRARSAISGVTVLGGQAMELPPRYGCLADDDSNQAAVSRAEALMWAQCCAYSPMLDGQLLNPF